MEFEIIAEHDVAGAGVNSLARSRSRFIYVILFVCSFVQTVFGLFVCLFDCLFFGLFCLYFYFCI